MAFGRPSRFLISFVKGLRPSPDARSLDLTCCTMHEYDLILTLTGGLAADLLSSSVPFANSCAGSVRAAVYRM